MVQWLNKKKVPGLILSIFVHTAADFEPGLNYSISDEPAFWLFSQKDLGLLNSS